MKESACKLSKYTVRKQAAPIDWDVRVPGSKSITNRALLLSALAEGKVRLTGVLFSEDSRCFLGSLQSLGFDVKIFEEEAVVEVCGCGGRIPADAGEIYVGSAGTAARFLTAMLGVSAGTYTIQASAQMQRRPMRPLFEALLSLGAKVKWLGEEWHLPVEIIGAGEKISALDGPCRLSLDISESTQFLSAFLLISPMFPKGVEIAITSEKKTGSYIAITQRMMESFGLCSRLEAGVYKVDAGAAYKREAYDIEPDVSAACYFFAAAAITGGKALVRGVKLDGLQGDLKFLDVLAQMGCTVQETPGGVAARGPVQLSGICVNMNNFSDQALTLAAVAPFCTGPVEISGIAHIRKQESDRVHAISSNLRRAGIDCEELADGVRILPGAVQPCEIETFDDHRVAMAFAVMGLKAEGVTILDPLCCRKTFEGFFDLLEELTA